MGRKRGDLPGLPTGEQPVVERVSAGAVVADTFAGRIHVEWDNGATVTPLGQLPFFIEFLRIRPPTINGTVSALRFFFTVTLGRADVARSVTFVAEPRKIPVILSPEEVARFLEAAPGPKYKAVAAD